MRKAYYDEQRRKERNYINYATEMSEEYKRKKRMALDRIEKAAKKKKEELLQKHEELKNSKDRLSDRAAATRRRRSL